MVLGEADPVEAELLDKSSALDHAVIGLGAGRRVVGAGGTGHSRGRSGGGVGSGRFRRTRPSSCAPPALPPVSRGDS